MSIDKNKTLEQIIEQNSLTDQGWEMYERFSMKKDWELNSRRTQCETARRNIEQVVSLMKSIVNGGTPLTRIVKDVAPMCKQVLESNLPILIEKQKPEVGDQLVYNPEDGTVSKLK